MVSRNYTRALVYWIPAVLWTAVILSASNDLFSTAHSGRWIGSILAHLLGHPPAQHQLEVINHLVRKAAHLTEYFILGALLFRALRGDASGFRARWAVLAIVLAACVAATDEWHQLFVPSRTSSAWDALLDSLGAAIAQLVWRYNSRS